MTLELENRRRIFQTIESHPGLHFRELQSRLGVAHGTLQYHLDRLVDEGLIAVSEDRGFTRYHPKTRLREEDRRLIDALRREYGRRILAHLASEGPLTTQALSARLGRSASTVSWHLARLAENGLVQRERTGQEVQYSLVDGARLVHLYTLYRASFTDRLVDRLLGLWDAY